MTTQVTTKMRVKRLSEWGLTSGVTWGKMQYWPCCELWGILRTRHLYCLMSHPHSCLPCTIQNTRGKKQAGCLRAYSTRLGDVAIWMNMFVDWPICHHEEALLSAQQVKLLFWKGDNWATYVCICRIFPYLMRLDRWGGIIQGFFFFLCRSGLIPYWILQHDQQMLAAITII